MALQRIYGVTILGTAPKRRLRYRFRRPGLAGFEEKRSNGHLTAFEAVHHSHEPRGEGEWVRTGVGQDLMGFGIP